MYLNLFITTSIRLFEHNKKVLTFYKDKTNSFIFKGIRNYVSLMLTHNSLPKLFEKMKRFAIESYRNPPNSASPPLNQF